MYTFDVEPYKDMRVIRPIKSDGAPQDGFTALKTRMAEVLGTGCRKIVLNMSDVDFIESRGLGVLVGALRQAQEAEALLVMCGVQPPLASVLQVVNFIKLFPIRFTREEAQDALAKVSARKGVMEKLVEANPTIMQLKNPSPLTSTIPTAEGGSVPGQRKKPASADAPAAEKSAPVEGASAGNSLTAPTTTLNAPPKNDWEASLALYADLRALCTRNSIEWRSGLTFPEIFAQLAERLATKR